MFHLLALSIFLLGFAVEHFTGDLRPSQKIASTVKGGEKAILLPPNQVIVLEAHTDHLNRIKVRERDHDDAIVRLKERKPVAKFVLANQAALPTDCGRQFVLVDFTLQNTL